MKFIKRDQRLTATNVGPCDENAFVDANKRTHLGRVVYTWHGHAKNVSEHLLPTQCVGMIE
jgi:hypothetical protein